MCWPGHICTYPGQDIYFLAWTGMSWPRYAKFICVFSNNKIIFQEKTYRTSFNFLSLQVSVKFYRQESPGQDVLEDVLARTYMSWPR